METEGALIVVRTFGSDVTFAAVSSSLFESDQGESEVYFIHDGTRAVADAKASMKWGVEKYDVAIGVAETVNGKVEVYGRDKMPLTAETPAIAGFVIGAKTYTGGGETRSAGTMLSFLYTKGILEDPGNFTGATLVSLELGDPDYISAVYGRSITVICDGEQYEMDTTQTLHALIPKSCNTVKVVERGPSLAQPRPRFSVFSIMPNGSAGMCTVELGSQCTIVQNQGGEKGSARKPPLWAAVLVVILVIIGAVLYFRAK